MKAVPNPTHRFVTDPRSHRALLGASGAPHDPDARAAPLRRAALLKALAAASVLVGVGLSFGLPPSAPPGRPSEMPPAPVARASFVRAPAKDVPPRFDAAGDPLRAVPITTSLPASRVGVSSVCAVGAATFAVVAWMTTVSSIAVVAVTG